MIRKTHLHKLLNVRSSEWNLVTKLFWLQFFQSTGIAFFFTASFSNFLDSFPATELAWVMILSFPLLFITGWLFNKFEHKWNLSKLGAATIISMAASILLFQIANQYINAEKFYYFMFAWYYVLYLASNLCFWSITSTLFDVRQSKRLFSVISAGDIPAKFIGYTVAYLFVKTVGTNNLLWPAILFMLCSLPFLFRLSKLGVIKHHHHNQQPDFTVSSSGNKLMGVIKRFTLNTLIRRVAILSFLISCCLAIINYAFYTEVKEGNPDDKSLSNFILLFLAGSQIIALLVKLIFTSRITTSLGIKKSLLITPLVLLMLLAFIISAEMFMGNHKIIFYVFGGAAITIEVLRTAINTPVFLAVMQPLNHIEKSKAHAIVKGIMDPFAFLISGTLLLLLTKFMSGAGLLGICIVLMTFTLAWILSILLVNKSYHHLLLKTISSRFFSQDEFSLSEEDIQKQIKKKIETGNDLEVINILQMLNSEVGAESKELIFSLLDHPSDNVKKETILLIGSRNLKGATSKLYWLANHSLQKEVRWLSVQVICKEENSHAHQKHFIHDHDPHVRSAALSGMLLSPDQQAQDQAEEIISNLFLSDKSDDKLSAIFILDTVKEYYSHPMHQQFFKEAGEIKIKAIAAVGKSASPELLNNLFLLFSENQRQASDALQAAGEKSVAVIYSNISSSDFPKQLKEKLISLLGKIGGQQSHHALIQLLGKNNEDTAAIVKALYRSHYKCSPDTQTRLENISAAYIIYGVELLYMQKYLQPGHPNFSELIHSLELELLEIRNVLLSIFGCLYDRKNIFKIRQGLDMKKKESAANAMEIIELIVRKDLASDFNILFEQTDIDQRCYLLKSFLPHEELQKATNILERILDEKPIEYSSWTKAYSMYISKKHSIHVNPELIKKFTSSSNILLQETAWYAKLNH